LALLGVVISKNPLLVFLTVIFWGWLWGYVGALLAFRLLVSAKIVCRSVDALQPFADFLEDTWKTEGDSYCAKWLLLRVSRPDVAGNHRLAPVIQY
jgi:uncharacterized RDD family membrane protein YckC